jgi:hypothetical protein
MIKETLRCPRCDSTDVVTEDYDFGICRKTGYSDSGVAARCQACGCVGPEEDFLSKEDPMIETLRQLLERNPKCECGHRRLQHFVGGSISNCDECGCREFKEEAPKLPKS